MVPFFVHFFDENGRKITRPILCSQAGKQNGMDCMGYVGFEKRP